MRKFSLLIAGLFVSVFAFIQLSTQPVSAAPISCSGRAYMVRTEVNAGNEYTQLYEFLDDGASVDLDNMYNDPTGLTDGGTPISDTAAFPNGYVLNALAYNPVDGYMYAARNDAQATPQTSNGLYRINDDGSLELAHTVNFAVSSNLKGAAFAPNGTFYAIGFGNNTHDTLYIVNGLNNAPGTPATSTTITLSTPINMGDLVFDHTTNTLYAISNITDMLYSIDTTTGNVTTISTGAPNGPGVSLGTNAVGSLFMTATGSLMGYVNETADNSAGQLVSINKTNGVMTLSKTGPVTNNSDATSCVPVGYTIDTVKSAGLVTGDGSTQFTVPYTIRVANLGTIDDPNIQVVDNLSQTFASGSPTITVNDLSVTDGPCTPNLSFDGTTDFRLLTGTDTLVVDDSCTMTFNVHLQYPTEGDVPLTQQLNTAYASTSSTGPNAGHEFVGGNVNDPFNVLATDASTDSANFPGTENGDSPDPTPVILSLVRLDVVKSAGSVTTVDSTHFTVPYTVIVGNTGDVAAPNVQVVDNLMLTFAAGSPEIVVSDTAIASGPCTVNTSYNGLSDIRLLAGSDTLDPAESCAITFTVSLAYESASVIPTEPQNNVALASSTSSGSNPGHTYNGTTPVPPANLVAQDNSTDSNALPISPQGDTPSPTPVTLIVVDEPLADTGVNQLSLAAITITVVVALGGASAMSIRSALRR